MTCYDALRNVFAEETGVLTTAQVTERIYAAHPDRPWKKNTISAHLIAFSVNHPSRRHHRSAWNYGFLFSLGNGRYRKWRPEEDGMWAVDETGVRLVDESEDAIEAVDGAGTNLAAEETSLSLERDLERSLVGNLNKLMPGLKLYEADGVTGQQLDTGVVGRLDLLAVDPAGDLVVIELKAGRADDKVCGQILRYMGWVKRELAAGRCVRGLIVASEFSEAMRFAVQAMPDVTLKRYEVRFSFSEVE
jgi:hypothetical protein